MDWLLVRYGLGIDNVPITSFLLFVGTALSSLFVSSSIKARKRMPLPMSLPHKHNSLFGHALMISNKIEGFGEICVKGADENGLSCFYLLNTLCVGVTHAEHIKDVLQTEIYRQGGLHTTKFLGDRSLLLMHGEEWKSHRKIITRAFKWEHLQEMVGDMNLVGKILVKVLAQKHGQIIDIWPLMKSTTLEVIGLTAFGYKFGDLENGTLCPIAAAMDLLNSEYNRRMYESHFNPFAHDYFLPIPSNIAYKHAQDIYRGTISNLIKLRREAIAAGQATHIDMMTYLLDAHDGDDNGNAKGSVVVDDLTLESHLSTILGAGFETSSVTLTYVFYLVSIYPDVEARALAEIKKVLGDDRMPTYEDLKTGLVYCNAVIMEVLRLYPPVPLLARWLQNPITLQQPKVTIQPGTLCIMPIWWINRSPHHFDNPDEFNPDRFLDEDKDIHRYGYLTFSSGARDCVGRRFAMLELVAVFAITLRKIKFSPKEGFVLKPVPTGVVQKPEGGMPLHVHIR